MSRPGPAAGDPRRSRLAPALLILAAAGLAGCASALRVPPTLERLASTLPRKGPGEVESLLAAARIEYAERTLESVRRAREIWLQAALADPERIEGLIGTARASAWLAGHEGEKEMRLQAAEMAVQAGQLCQQARPSDPACAYWLGAGLGLQAQERRSTALDALPRIEEAFRRAAGAAPGMEHGGPSRALALLYARAPGWPTGPGDPDLAVESAREALGLAPEYPPNHLALAEALAAVDDEEGSRRAYRAALERATRGEFSHDPDAAEWIREARKALRMETD